MQAEITIIYSPELGLSWIPKVKGMAFLQTITNDEKLQQLFADINTRLDELADQCKKEEKE